MRVSRTLLALVSFTNVREAVSKAFWVRKPVPQHGSHWWSVTSLTRWLDLFPQPLCLCYPRWLILIPTCLLSKRSKSQYSPFATHLGIPPPDSPRMYFTSNYPIPISNNFDSILYFSSLSQDISNRSYPFPKRTTSHRKTGFGQPFTVSNWKWGISSEHCPYLGATEARWTQDMCPSRKLYSQRTLHRHRPWPWLEEQLWIQVWW